MFIFSKPGDLAPQRVVSLQPSVTVTLDRLGLLDRLVACTRYCADVVPGVRQGRAIVADSWTAQSAEIMAAKPDLVIASVPYQVEAVTEIMKAGISFLGLAPHSLRDVCRDMVTIASVMGAANEGHRLVREMEMEIERVRGRNRQRQIRPRVWCEEWGKPLIASQPWVAELVEAAGGAPIGEPGRQTTPEAVLQDQPEVILAAWCGAGDRVPLEKIIAQRGWEGCAAVQKGRVFCINDEFLNTPSLTLLQGLHAIDAALSDPPQPAPGLRRIREKGVTSV